MNLPLPAGSGEEQYLGVFREQALPALRGFGRLLIVSAGFDAHRGDPLCSLGLSAAAFGAMAGELRELCRPARACAGGRLRPGGARDGVAAVLGALRVS